MSKELVANIEVALIIGIGLLQVGVFFNTVQRIIRYKKALPYSSNLKRSIVYIPRNVIKNAPPQELLESLDEYRVLPPAEDSSRYTKLSILECDKHLSSEAAKVLFTINSYLVRNGDSSIDFDLMKDITDRHSIALEEDINSTVSVPLYLGLMGTLLGIVIGLFNMPSLGATSDSVLNDDLLNEGISLLIGGVKIAMIASFLGLLLTTISSAFIFKGARSHVDAQKNELYTFIQVELLPIVNEGMASTMNSLQRNLLQFNEQFTHNLKRLTGVFESNERAILAQKSLLDTIDKTKVGEMTSYNVKVLKELGNSVQHFEAFNLNLGSTAQLVGSTNEFLERTNDFQVIAKDIQNTMTNSNYLLEFLSKHFKELEKHGNAVNGAVADVGHTLSDTFSELKEHIRISSDQIKQFTVDESELLRVALSQSKTNLNNLEHLKVLKEDVAELRNYSKDQNTALLGVLSDVSGELKKIRVGLETKIESRTRRAFRRFMDRL